MELRDRSLDTMDVLKCKLPHTTDVFWASGNIHISHISHKLVQTITISILIYIYKLELT